jgi:hypothetical protein
MTVVEEVAKRRTNTPSCEGYCYRSTPVLAKKR